MAAESREMGFLRAMQQSYEAYYANGVLTWLGKHHPIGPARVKVTLVEEGISPAGRRHPSPRIAGKGETRGELIEPIAEELDWDGLKALWHHPVAVGNCGLRQGYGAQ